MVLHNIIEIRRHNGTKLITKYLNVVASHLSLCASCILNRAHTHPSAYTGGADRHIYLTLEFEVYLCNGHRNSLQGTTAIESKEDGGLGPVNVLHSPLLHALLSGHCGVSSSG